MRDPLKALAGWLRGAEAPESQDAAPRRAVAVLLVEAARMDGTYSAEERAKVRTLLAKHFGLTPEAAEALARAGEAAQDGAVELFGFARAVTGAMTEAAREDLIEMLWEVVYADGRLHDFEANMMRRMAGLLYVSDRASALARKRVESRLSAPTAGEGAMK